MLHGLPLCRREEGTTCYLVHIYIPYHHQNTHAQVVLFRHRPSHTQGVVPFCRRLSHRHQRYHSGIHFMPHTLGVPYNLLSRRLPSGRKATRLDENGRTPIMLPDILENPNIRRPVSETVVSQTASYWVQDTIGPEQLNADGHVKRHIPNPMTKKKVVARVERQSQIPSSIIIAKVNSNLNTSSNCYQEILLLGRLLARYCAVECRYNRCSLPLSRLSTQLNAC